MEVRAGVRNYAARNNMRAMKAGDVGFFYHSNTKRPGIVGVFRVVKEAHPDATAWEAGHPYFDDKSSKDAPRWDAVDVEFVRRLPRMVSLAEIKADSALASMQLLTRARLSVSEVSPEEWSHILALSDGPEPDLEKAPPKKRADAGFAAFVRNERKSLPSKLSAREASKALAERWEALSEEQRMAFRGSGGGRNKASAD
jgi:predicted RNA-binding protein with PUA-like domain